MTVELGILIALLSLLIAYLTYSNNRNKTMRDDGQQNAEMKSELGYIRKGVDDIRIDIKATEKQLITLGERITRVEESSKQAHKRLNGLEKERDEK